MLLVEQAWIVVGRIVAVGRPSTSMIPFSISEPKMRYYWAELKPVVNVEHHLSEKVTQKALWEHMARCEHGQHSTKCECIAVIFTELIALKII